MGNKLDKFNQPLYELKDSCSLQMKYPSSAIATNQSGSLILQNIHSTILIIGFDGKSLRHLSRCKKHECSISVLKFFNLREQFISGSSDHSIIIWPTILYLGTTAKYLQKLQGHTEMITCLAIHPLHEDLIVSGDYNKRIKFWQMSQSLSNQQSSLQWRCIQDIMELNSSVHGISINEIGNQVICCDRNSLILLVCQIKNRSSITWWCWSDFFIKDDRFIFQSTSESTLDLYILQQEGKYNKVQQVRLKYCQDEQIRQALLYNKKQNILIVKKGQKLFIIKFDEQNNSDQSKIKNEYLNLKCIQQIDFKEYFFYRALSDNGQYLITKDALSNQIQIRCLKKANEV